ncbi:hypothetical protein HY251_06445 [bacterium]|nr:hypothetical protein [bacterium]
MSLALALGFLIGGTMNLTGCAALTGLVTGAFTGAVDAPAEVYRHHRGDFTRNPIYWPFNVLFFVPLGIAAGPIAGFGKGLALDMEWLIDRTPYDRAFGTYKEPSVWRPYTIHW